MSERRRETEWPTLLLLAGCYALWAVSTTLLAAIWLPAGIAALVLALTLHSSLQHEALHGHPFRDRIVNEALVFLPIGLFYPYRRFRDLHLDHHRDENLTDPYDDPESNYLDPLVWNGLPAVTRHWLRFNNTLLGRMLLGPAISVVSLLRRDAPAILLGARGVGLAWLLHLAGLVPVAIWIGQSAMPVWAYLLAAYGALSVLKIRTFLEHRAHDLARSRTVIVEGGGVLPFLFLNNNLHVVHHCKPGLAWYRLPALYRARRDEFLRRNEAYVYRSYGDIFRQYFLKAKDPVPHPLRPQQ